MGTVVIQFLTKPGGEVMEVEGRRKEDSNQYLY